MTAFRNDSSSHLPPSACRSQSSFLRRDFWGCWTSERRHVLGQHSLKRRPLSHFLGGTPRITTCFSKVWLSRTASTPSAYCATVPTNNATAFEHKKTQPAFQIYTGTSSWRQTFWRKFIRIVLLRINFRQM